MIFKVHQNNIKIWLLLLLYYYYRKKRFRWRNVKRLQAHLTNAKDSDKTRVRRKWEQSICQMQS